MLKRLFDIFFSLAGILILLPFFIVIAICIVIDSRGGVFYSQERIGRGGAAFRLLKFRSMYSHADQAGLLTVGERDGRITRTGYFIRKYKIDEFPQLINVLKGEMSIVGPRPEVKKYVDMYSEEQRKVLSVRPGLTDYASIEYSRESELLGKAADPEKVYVEEVMPAKLALNMNYIREKNLLTDVKIIFRTFIKILK
jgi:lipopolysaccharide/colanic/teichoic acid biosynthesis glycosyltransferase